MRSPLPLSQDALYGRGPFLRPGCVVPPISGTTAPSAARRPPGDFTVVAYTPGPLPGRLLLQVFGAFRGLRRDKSGSAPPCPLRVVSYGAAGFTWMLRTGQLLPPEGLSTLGFDAGGFPPDAASLLRGLLAATPAGLSPAGGCVLMRGSSRWHPLPRMPTPLGTIWSKHQQGGLRLRGGEPVPQHGDEV